METKLTMNNKMQRVMQKIYYYYIARDIKINYCSPGEDGTSSEVGNGTTSDNGTTSSPASVETGNEFSLEEKEEDFSPSPSGRRQRRNVVELVLIDRVIQKKLLLYILDYCIVVIILFHFGDVPLYCLIVRPLFGLVFVGVATEARVWQTAHFLSFLIQLFF